MVKKEGIWRIQENQKERWKQSQCICVLAYGNASQKNKHTTVSPAASPKLQSF